MRFVLTETDSRNSSTTIYNMNLADIHPPSIEVNVRGKEVTIELQTAQRADFIRVEEDGEQRNYTNSLSLHCAEVDEAQTMAYALRQLIPKAQATEESMQPATADPATATEALQELLTEFKQDDTSIRQSLDGTCEVTYTRIEDDGEAEEQQFIFNFADLQPNKVEIDVRGTAIEVTVETAGGENFIYVSKNGEQQNYADDLSFPAPDIPSAKLIRHYLVQLIEQCPKEIAPADWEGIQAAIAEAETYAEGLFQQVELLEGDACKWGLTVQEEGSRRSSEERYEFNLYDLDARRMELAVRGKDVSINLFTLRNDEIIKNYTDGEELGYEKEVSFRVKDIATGKAVIAGLQVLIGGCEE